MKINKVKVAVVGCGMISHVYLRNMTRMFSILDVVAVCDLDPQLAQQAAKEYGIPQVMTLDEIAASQEIELVVNLTAPAVHYDIIRKLLMAGKHVYTEKTITAHVEDAQALVSLAKQRGLRLAVAPDTVLGASVQTARWAVDSGLIGTPTSCVVSVNRNQGLNSELYRFLRGAGGGLPFDMGVYYVQALLTILGPVAEVVGYALPAPAHERQFLFREDEPEGWQILGSNLSVGALKFQSGVLGMMHFDGNTIGTERPAFRIFGTDGILEIGDPNNFGEPVTLIKPESPPCVLPMSHGYNGKSVLADATDFEKNYGHRGIGVAELAWAIRKNRPHRLSAELGLHTLEVLCGLDTATGTPQKIESTFVMPALKSGYYCTMWGGSMRADAELSLVD